MKELLELREEKKRVKNEDNRSEGADKKREDHEQEVSFVAAEGTVKTNIWIADSGSSSHMTSNRSWFKTFHELDTPKIIRLGNGSALQATGMGKIMTREGTLHSVYFVEGLVVNLFSISAATCKVLVVQYKENSVEFYFHGRKVLEGFKRNGTYELSLHILNEEVVFVAKTLDTWHEIFGHVSKETIQKMYKLKCVKGFDITAKEESPVCESCAIGKCTKVEHPLRSTRKASQPGFVLHFDTEGPVKPLSLGSSQYFVLCKDEFSSYRQVAFVQTKSEIPVQVKKMISVSTLEANGPLKIKTDNGTEFVNEDVRNFLQARGIIHETSVVKTPQQNGFVERDIRTVMECARTLLIRSALPKALWSEAEIWDCLENAYGMKTSNTKLELMTELGSFHW